MKFFFKLMKIFSIVFIENLMFHIMFDMFLLFKLNAKITLNFREKTTFSLNICNELKVQLCVKAYHVAKTNELDAFILFIEACKHLIYR